MRYNFTISRAKKESMFVADTLSRVPYMICTDADTSFGQETAAYSRRLSIGSLTLVITPNSLLLSSSRFIAFRSGTATHRGTVRACGCAPSWSLMVWSTSSFHDLQRRLENCSVGLFRPRTPLTCFTRPSASTAGRPKSGLLRLPTTNTSCYTN